MEILTLKKDAPIDVPTVATIGFFDGVHRGHRFLIQYVQQRAYRKDLPSLVITFKQHPRQVVQPHFIPALLSTPEEKLAMLQQMGVDRCILLDFDEKMARLSAHQFMQRVLKRQLGVADLVIGHDNRFGHNRQEGFADYLRYGLSLGMAVTEAPRFVPYGETISSSSIRRLLEKGDVSAAHRALGYAYKIGGTVVPGFQEGRKLGFPTANLVLENPQKLLPRNGVYATRVEIEGLEDSFLGMTNIGHRPTFGGQTTTIETHILDFNGLLYDRHLRLSFFYRIRDEEKFDSLRDLQIQLAADKRKVRTLFILNNRTWHER